jgi:iron only hydrogenase large subunit-like protein
MGVARVLDTTASRDLSLLESCEEFVSRYRNAKHAAVTNTPPPSPADVLPVLTSACPGWVCYAEKTHGGAVLNHVSAVKSPQQVMGCIVKRKIAAELGVPASAVFHATVMPCFDKKLEASREDFAMDDLGENVREVDCVLTTGEVAEMIAVAAGLGAPSSGGGDGAGATLDSGELGKGELAAKGAAALALVNPARSTHWSPYDRVRVVNAIS